MKPVTIIGTGAVGSSIALSLFSAGVPIVSLYSRRGITARKLAKKIRISINSSFNDLSALGAAIIICVPDNEINGVARSLASSGIPLKGKSILHTSGALSSTELEPVKAKGAAVGSFHPLQTFPRAVATPLSGIWFGLEGDRKAVAVGQRLAAIVGARSFVISKEAKVQYHIASVFASNYIVTLLSVIDQIGKTISLPKNGLSTIYRPIIERSVHNACTTTPAQALTGPIERGDMITVQRHLKALGDKSMRHILPLYTALGIETARLAMKKRKK